MRLDRLPLHFHLVDPLVFMLFLSAETRSLGTTYPVAILFRLLALQVICKVGDLYYFGKSTTPQPSLVDKPGSRRYFPAQITADFVLELLPTVSLFLVFLLVCRSWRTQLLQQISQTLSGSECTVLAELKGKHIRMPR